MDRRIGRVEAGPGGAGVEVLVDEPVIESGKRHAFRTPLSKPDAVAPAVTAEAHRPRRRRRRTGRPVSCAGPAECRKRRLGLVTVERRLERAALPLKAGEPDQRLAPQAVELAVITGDLGHLAGDRVRARLQRIEQRREVGASLGQHAALRLQRVAFGAQLACQLQLADRDLLQVDGAVEQVIETAGGKDELEPAHPTERVELAHVRLESAYVLQVSELVV